MVSTTPHLPWSPDRTRQSLRGRLLVKVRDEGPQQAPHYLKTDIMAAPLHFDRGRIDQVIHRHSHAMQVTRAYQPSRSSLLGSPVHWDDLEQETGLARTYRIDVDPDASLKHIVDSLRDLDSVELATPHYLCNTPFSSLDYGLVEENDHDAALYRASASPKPDAFYAQRMVGVQEALAFEPGDSALLVGVVDSGVDLSHPEILSAIRPGVDTVDLPVQVLNSGIKLIGDGQSPDRIPRDEIGHGTACSSIIAARGLRVPHGLAGAAQILPARALAGVQLLDTHQLTAMGALPDIDQSVKTLVDLGAKVLNLSFGTPASVLLGDDPLPHSDVIEYALKRGCVLVAASGNDGQFNRYFPAAHPGVIAVGAVGATGEPSLFTTRGDHVLLSAPGEKIMAATLGGDYKGNTGTSFAAPFVTGACALLLSRAARYGRPIDTPTIKAFLSAYARPFAFGSDTRGCGAGILDVPASLHGLEQALSSAASDMPVNPMSATGDALYRGFQMNLWPQPPPREAKHSTLHVEHSQSFGGNKP